MKDTDLTKKKLGEVLLEAGLISKVQLEEALALQRRTKRRLGRLLIELGYVDQHDLCLTISKQLKIPLLDLEKITPDEEAVSKVTEELARERGLIPVSLNGRDLTIAMSNPLDWMTTQEVEFSTGMNVHIVIAPENAILRAIDRYLERRRE